MDDDHNDIERFHLELNTMDEESSDDCNQDVCVEQAMGLESAEDNPSCIEGDILELIITEKQKVSEYNQDVLVEPTLGMEFESYVAAGKFYNSYAKHVGFDTKIRQSRSNTLQGKWYVQFSCNKEGFKRAKTAKSACTRRDRPDMRCGCLATMKIRLVEHNKWRVFYVNVVHNHAMNPRHLSREKSEKSEQHDTHNHVHDRHVGPVLQPREIGEDPNDIEEDMTEMCMMEIEETAKCNQDAYAEPTVGMEFESYVAAGKFYNVYARYVGFDTKIRQSRSNLKHGKRYVQFSCNKEGFKRAKAARPVDMRRDRPDIRCGCLATMKIKLIGHDKWRVFHVNLIHNHAVGQRKKRHDKPFMQLDNRGKSTLPLDAKADLESSRTSQSFAAESQEHDKMSSKQMEYSNFDDNNRQLGLGDGDTKAINMFFVRMQTRSSNFFYSIDLDNNGYMRNVVWVDARSKAAYGYFGDVVTLYTTNLVNMNGLIFAQFVGINHHGQLILLGSGLLSIATKESLVWIFKKWLMAMSDHPPNAIICDDSEAVQVAIAEVFPQTHFRICLWHIMKKIPENLGMHAEYKEIKRAMKKVVYESLKVHEFEQEWNHMIAKFNLDANRWLIKLYQSREKWVPVFLKHAFWAGMSTTKRGEGVISFFDDHLHLKTCFKDFFEQYETTLKDKYANEAAADLANSSCKPIPRQTHWFEAQLVDIYTTDVFTKFQQEVSGMLRCYDMSPIPTNEGFTIYRLKERIMNMDGQLLLPKEYEVYYYANEMEVTCICNLFQFKGFLCRHALYVLQNQGVVEIPSRYILRRWKKDYKHNSSPWNGLTNLKSSTSTQWYDLIHRKCNEIVEEGALSEKGCLVALQVLEDVQQKIQVVGDKAAEEQEGKKASSSEIISSAPDITINNYMPLPIPNAQAIINQLINNRTLFNLQKPQKVENQKETSCTSLAVYDSCTASGTAASPKANTGKKRPTSSNCPVTSNSNTTSETVVTPVVHDLNAYSLQQDTPQMVIFPTIRNS